MADWSWSQSGQGAMGGAMAGGAIGGPLGAGIGAVAGGIFGGFGGDPNEKYRNQLEALARGYGKRKAPQMGPAAQARQSQLIGNRSALIAQLEAQARGEGPSAAAIQMREAMDRAAGAQSSAAAGAGGRGVNAGAAMRNAMNNTAAVQAQGARDTATLRAQEQLNATSQLGSVIGQGIGQDNQHSQWNAGAMNDVSQANMMAKLQMIGLNDEAQLRALMGAMGAAPQGMGTSILAGGAMAVPGIMQYRQQQRAAGAGGAALPGGFSPMGVAPTGWMAQNMGGNSGGGPVTSPFYDDPIAPYRRNAV